MAAFRDLAPQIRPEAQECPLAIIENEARKTARDFCERTTYWRHTHAPIDTGNATGEYQLIIPSGAQIGSVLSPARHRRELIEQQTIYWLDENVPNWEEQTNLQARYFSMIEPTKMRLVPYPTTADAATATLKVRISLKPNPSATEFPDFVFNEWYEILAHGVLASLFARQGAAYYKPALVPFHETKYEDGILLAREKAVSEFRSTFADRDHRVEPNYF